MSSITRYEAAVSVSDATNFDCLPMSQSYQTLTRWSRLVAQQREFVGLNPKHETRRKAAIERVTAAIKAKDGAASRNRLITSNLRNAGG